MSEKKKPSYWVTVGVLGFVVFLLLGSLVFVEVAINVLDSSLEQKQTNVVLAFEERSTAVNTLVSALKPKMNLDPKPFNELADAEKQLKEATDVKALSDANLKVDLAIDNLIFVMHDKYNYLETPEVLEIEAKIDSARSKIVIESTNYNDTAKEYNFAVENFPGSFLSIIFSHENTEIFKIVDYANLV